MVAFWRILFFSFSLRHDRLSVCENFQSGRRPITLLAPYEKPPKHAGPKRGPPLGPHFSNPHPALYVGRHENFSSFL
ncbi:hypothetical protein F5X96DRAFT_660918 [Biscogniauxia mediterranea]|nr:hypothetical protein F5X96DRAFT_660918 [Biscogniauxia mediterranea]